MFKLGNTARNIREKNSSSEEKPQKKISAIGEGDNPSATSVQSPNDGKTIIGAGVIIEGKICGSGNLIIEGLMKGDVELEGSSITVGPKGRIEGEIIAKDTIINGQMNGKINAAGTVNIARHADFCGEIKAKNISIDDGAFFNGKIDLDREPNQNIDTTNGLMFKPIEKQNKVSLVSTAKRVTP